MSAETVVEERCRACGHLYGGKASDEDLQAHLAACPGPCPECGETRHGGKCREPFECDICAEEVECCCDEDRGCMSCGGSGYRTPEHCCSCGNGPYCQCCKRCGASCMGSCRCPVEVRGFDGEVITILPGNPPDGDNDRRQEFKDDVAVGYIDRAGNQLEQPEPDWGAVAGGDAG
jgi:hypothetical protein